MKYSAANHWDIDISNQAKVLNGLIILSKAKISKFLGIVKQCPQLVEKVTK